MGTVIAFPLGRVIRQTEIAPGHSADIRILPVVRIEREEGAEVRPAPRGDAGAAGRQVR